MLRKPVPMTKNSILQAIRTQRKSKGEIKWVVIGLMRDSVPPTALILDQRLLTEKGWYDPEEYDVLAKVDGYDEFKDMRQLTTQQSVVDFIYGQAIQWQNARRKERKRIEQEPITTLLHNFDVKEVTLHTADGKVIHEEVEDYSAGTYSVDYLLRYIADYTPETYDGVKEDKIEILYQIDVYDRQKDEYDRLNVFLLTIPVGEEELEYDLLKFKWVLPEGKFGINANHYKSDPVYRHIGALAIK